MITSDPDLNFKVKKSMLNHYLRYFIFSNSNNHIVLATEKISENMHIVANEPSLALYRIQEHVRKVLPMIVDRKAEVLQLQQELQGHCYDMEYAVGYVYIEKIIINP